MPPTPSQIKAVCDERLGRWTRKLVAENATPLVLIGVSHGQKSGQLVVCVPEEVSDELVKGSITFLYETMVLGRPR